ncbi:MAG: hypothetical protein KKF46_07895 [Nanoarchaeota archaeon]|nr:hypothetical protein [Nanoarchaeota archaeon]MBU1322250.1 hypothetical protein [Nanoarchaeota archaeon]MBU1598230.1 hypothetical protein [Nanoarchaeota archaeon]MBU2441983.1 hypothetical protein [Nanoarchaeota archaeon]
MKNKLTLELAQIAALITSDGHLQIKEWRYLTSFYSKDLDEINRVKKLFKKVFDVEGRIYEDRSPGKKVITLNLRYKLFFISKSTALFLKRVGVPKGNKTNTPFQVPGWIINGSNEIKSAYLRSLFDCEGSIFFTKQYKNYVRWRISLTFCKNKDLLDDGLRFLSQIRSLLNNFYIKASPIRYWNLNIRKDGSQSVEMRFEIEKSSFGNFYKYIGFNTPNKQIKLLSALAGERP